MYKPWLGEVPAPGPPAQEAGRGAGQRADGEGVRHQQGQLHHQQLAWGEARAWDEKAGFDEHSYQGGEQ